MEERTRKELSEIFVEESVRGARCELVALRAEQQGEPETAALFRAMQAAAEVQARRVLLQLRGALPESKEFVRELAGYTGECLRKFLPRLKTAAEDVGDHREAELAGRFRRVAANHASLLKKVAEGRSRGEELFVCTVCGFIAESDIPEHCPVCKAVPKRFAVNA
ncbi:MAG TPA: hypothetical protein VJ934_01690 [Desulfomicrobiaceae bacterium]|nr:hypothetical protein [Desulfomicrobiaceae bacterium]